MQRNKKVFFSASIIGLIKYSEQYQIIVQTIKNSGHDLILNWTKSWIKEFKKLNQGNIVAKRNFINKIKRLRYSVKHTSFIEKSTFIIAEVSEPTISVGYQTFYAASHKKPVLALCWEELPKEKMNYIKSIIDTENKFIIFRKYNLDNIREIIKYFLQKPESRLIKFNFLISKEIENYLDWHEKNKKIKSRSEFLREKIITEIIAKDQEYQKR